MNRQSAVWIDHEKAVIVRLTDNGEEIKQLLAEPDTGQPSDGEAREQPGHTPRDFLPEDRRDRKKRHRLNTFYDQVVHLLRDADAILVFGPGEAKGEFGKRLAHHRLSSKLVATQPSDKLTDPQIAAFARRYFESNHPALLANERT